MKRSTLTIILSVGALALNGIAAVLNDRSQQMQVADEVKKQVDEIKKEVAGLLPDKSKEDEDTKE